MTGRVELLIYWRVLLGPDVDSEGTLGSTGDEHSGDFLWDRLTMKQGMQMIYDELVFDDIMMLGCNQAKPQVTQVYIPLTSGCCSNSDTHEMIFWYPNEGILAYDRDVRYRLIYLF